MLKSALITLLASAATLAMPILAKAEQPKTRQAKTQAAPAPARSGRIAVRGIDYYYEIRGEGQPLLLLHGGLGSIDMFGPVMATLAEDRTVIGVDLQGHGRTTLGERPIDLKAIGDDLAAILEKLGYNQVDVLGYSFGGGAGFRLAVQHPDVVRRLALVSAGYARDGFYPEMLPMQAAVSGAMADMMKDTPMYKSYMAVAPKPDDFPKLLDRMGEYMRVPYDWSDEVKALTMPVMLVFGDSDMYRPEHIVKFYQLLGGGLKDAGWMRENMSRNRLAIIPNRTHYDVFFAPELASMVLPFLNGETSVATWDEMVGAQQ